MNHQFIQQQQHQQQQQQQQQQQHHQNQLQSQPPNYGGTNYDGLNLNASANIMKNSGTGNPQFPPSQKSMMQNNPMPTPPPPTSVSSLTAPAATIPQNPYNYNLSGSNNMPGHLPPSHQMNQSSNLSNQMANMTLNNQQQKPPPLPPSANYSALPQPPPTHPAPQQGSTPMSNMMKNATNINGFTSSAGSNDILSNQAKINPPSLPPSQSMNASETNQKPPMSGLSSGVMSNVPPGSQRVPGNMYMAQQMPINQDNMSNPPTGSFNMYGQQNVSAGVGVNQARPPYPPNINNQNLNQMPSRPGMVQPMGQPMAGQMPPPPPPPSLQSAGSAIPRQMPGTMPPAGFPQQRLYSQQNYPPQQQQQQQQPLGSIQDPYNQNQRNVYPPQGLNMTSTGVTPGYQPGVQAQQTKRLDPESMPSPIQVMQDDQKLRGGNFITNQKGLVPPFVTTKFTVQDQGNASPRFIRSTIYTVPTTADIMKQTGVPFALILNPMNKLSDGEQEPPIIDMGEVGPVRCVRCKAYMSPFMEFKDAGRRFQCMFCKAMSDVPAEYFQHLDHTGQRMDRFERPELMLGTYEFIATKDYCRNNNYPKPPAIIFAIDVSYNNIKSGLVNLLCNEMKNIIKNLPIDTYDNETKMKIGFITYSNTIHFYNINSCLSQPQMMVVGDVQDVFMPLLDGFLCDINDSDQVIDSLMNQIPIMFGDTRETETILGPVIQAGLEALKTSDCVGKLIIFHSTLPIADAPGKLKNRDDRKLLGTDKEKTILSPQNNFYNNLGQDCVNFGCSVDLFLFNNSYIDIATIGQISRLTGGEVYKYTYFQADIDGERLINDIINNISKPIAFDAVMRVRTSTGVRPTDFYGHFFMSNTTDMELASIDCNKSIAVEIKHDDKLTDEEGVYIQVALLYTSCSGVRRLRIHNLSLRTSSQMAELYKACDSDALINFLAKQSVSKLIDSTPKIVKDNLISKCATILAAYRKHCASPISASQLVLPECMKLLPLYVNCLIKSDAISGGADMTIDDRSYVMQAVTTMPLSTSVIYFYPRLFPLHDIDLQTDEFPQQIRCSFDKFTEDGAYLLENGIHMFLWMGLALSTEWIQSVFGTPVVDTDRSVLPVLDNPLNIRIRDIIDTIRSERYHCMRLTLVRQRDKLEMVLRHFLVEDRDNDGSPSYVDFLCHMHKEIKIILNQ